MEEYPIFNVLEYNWNTRKGEPYNVLPYFIRTWNDESFNFEKDMVKTKDDLKKWIERSSRYRFWARCEYEFLMAPWPFKTKTLVKDLYKIDVHKQIMMNIDAISNILFVEFKL